jgi:N-acetylneuraminate synthase
MMMKTGPTFVIAEAGVNHNGSLDIARELIDVAARAGADAVKFQTFRAEAVISRSARKAPYQIANTGNDESQLDMVRRLELSADDHRALVAHAREKGIEFLSTPADLDSVRVLTELLHLRRLKIGSGEVTNLPLLIKAARTGARLIVSTGMSNLSEVELALEALAFGLLASAEVRATRQAMTAAYLSDAGRQLLRERVTLLHCTTEYPAPVQDANLRAMETMHWAFGLPVGYSDHTLGIHIAVAAAALGAVILEKHFTLDRNMPGPDHVASLEPNELKNMVTAIRDTDRALGSGLKLPAATELKNKPIARKSLTAARDIRVGERFTEQNLTTKRPGTGICAAQYFEYLDRVASRDYSADDLIDEP